MVISLLKLMFAFILTSEISYFKLLHFLIYHRFGFFIKVWTVLFPNQNHKVQWSFSFEAKLEKSAQNWTPRIWIKQNLLYKIVQVIFILIISVFLWDESISLVSQKYINTLCHSQTHTSNKNNIKVNTWFAIMCRNISAKFATVIHRW